MIHRLRGRVVRSLRHHWSSLASLAARCLGVAAGFGVMFVIGRWYGPQANGQYAIVTQTAMFLSVVAVGGLDLAVTREMSRAVSENRKLARSTVWRVLGQASVGSVGLIALLAFTGDALLRFIGRAALPTGALIVLCTILLARTFTRLGAAVLRSQKDYVLSQLVEMAFIPLLTLAVLAIGLARTVDEILWTTAGAGLVTAMVAMAAIQRHITGGSEGLKISTATVRRTALPLWGVAITLNLAEWYGLAVASAMCGLYDAGLFRVAAQIAGMLTVVTAGLFGTFVAQISAAVHSGERECVARLAGSGTRLAAAVMLPMAVIGFVFARQILTLVDADFASATTVLRVLLIGQAVYAATGPAGMVLALTGHARINLAITVTATAALLICAPFAAHAFGILGVGAALSAILVFRNVASLLAVRRIEAIDLITGKLLCRDARAPTP